MALSKSVIKAQDIIPCNLCEVESKLSWKCMDCNLLMCNKCCDKIHPKFKNAESHTIVDMKQVGMSDGYRDFTNIKCELHPSQSCCIFCDKCDKLACPSCITKGHAGHTFIEIKEAYEMKLQWLNNRKGKLEMNQKILDDKEIKLNKIIARENFKCQKTLQDIQHEREGLNRKVDQYASELTEEVNQKMNIIQDSLSKELNNIKTTTQRMKSSNNAMNEMLSTTDTSCFFENADIVAQSFDDEVEGVSVIHISVPTFKPGEFFQSSVGTLHEDIVSIDSIIEMKERKQYTTGLKHCQLMSACSDGSLWIGDSSSNVLQKVNPEGDILTTVVTKNIDLRGIAVTHNNDLLITDTESKLKFINGTSGKVSDSKYSVDPLRIMSVHTTNDRKVIVGAKSIGVVYPVTGRRLVVEMDQEGNHLAMYDQDKHKQNIFSYPMSITSTSNGNIVVVDSLSDDRGRVLVVGKGGEVLNVYNGNQDIETEGPPFNPVNIVTSPSDNVIVFDVFSENLHILDSSTNLIYFHNTKDIGIRHPFCLAFNSVTTCYLGCSPPQGSTTNAKLYEIQCSGF